MRELYEIKSELDGLKTKITDLKEYLWLSYFRKQYCYYEWKNAWG